MRGAMSSAAAVLEGDDGGRDVAAANPPAVARYTMRARAPLFMRDRKVAGANLPQIHCCHREMHVKCTGIERESATSRFQSSYGRQELACSGIKQTSSRVALLHRLHASVLRDSDACHMCLLARA
jgi:hypothetical protein